MEENPEDSGNTPISSQPVTVTKTTVTKENKTYVKQEKSKQCEICMKEVENEKELKNHRELVHGPTSDKRFECQKCSKSCPTFESLIVHHIEAGESGNKHCGICHKEFEYEIGMGSMRKTTETQKIKIINA